MALITGASAGIGAVFARKLAPTHDLILVARRRERLEALAAELSGGGRAQVEVLSADLGREEDLARVAERIAHETNFDLLINNAGFGAPGFFWESPLEVQEQMQRLHILATVRLTHAALRNLLPRDRGAVINVASVAAFVRGAGSSTYGATKSWMTAFTEGLALELRASGSRVAVQALCPGFTYSEFHDVMGAKRESLAPRSFWLGADQVVNASLGGLRRRKLFVIPGWRYRVLVALLTKLPAGLRVALEARRPPREERPRD